MFAAMLRVQAARRRRGPRRDGVETGAIHRAFGRAAFTPAKVKPTRTPMMAMTTKSSTSVKPDRREDPVPFFSCHADDVRFISPSSALCRDNALLTNLSQNHEPQTYALTLCNNRTPFVSVRSGLHVVLVFRSCLLFDKDTILYVQRGSLVISG